MQHLLLLFTLGCLFMLATVSRAQTVGSPFTNPALSTTVSGSNTVVTATFTNGISQLATSNFEIVSAAGDPVSLSSATVAMTSANVWTLSFSTSLLSASTTYYITFLNSPAAVCTPPTLSYTTSPTAVVGTGTPASCTFAALKTAAEAGGMITFSCGLQPVTITFSGTINLVKNVTIDGGSRIILDGVNQYRLFTINGVPGNGNPSFQFKSPIATFLNLVFVNAKSTAPALSGTDGGGAAIVRTGGLLQVQNCLFHNCNGQPVGQDHAGGAIYSIGGVGQTVIGSIVTGSSCSNGGAMASIGTDAAYYNSIFAGNRASGYDKNPGNGGNGGALCYDGGNVTLTMCGLNIRGNTAGALGTIFRVGYNNVNDITTISKTWLDDNVTNKSASGLYLQDHKFSLTETTISNSVATTGYGGFQMILGNYGNSFDYFTVYNVKAGANSESLCAAGSFAAPSSSTAVPGATWTLNRFVAIKNNGTFAALCPANPLTLTNAALQNYHANIYEKYNCLSAASGAGPAYQWPRFMYGTSPDTNCSATNTIYPGDLGLGDLADNGCAVPTVTRLGTSPVPTSVTAGCASPAPAGRKVTSYVMDQITNWPLHWPVTSSFVTASSLGSGTAATVAATVTTATTGTGATSSASSTAVTTSVASTTMLTTTAFASGGASGTSTAADSTSTAATVTSAASSTAVVSSTAAVTAGAAGASKSASDGKLSGGAIAGIVIGVIVAIAVVVGLLVYFLVFRNASAGKDDFVISS